MDTDNAFAGLFIFVLPAAIRKWLTEADRMDNQGKSNEI